jgi:hypothetical protein
VTVKDDKIVSALSEISARLQSLEAQGRNLQGILVEQSQEISDIRSHQLDDSDRVGGQVKRHETELISINARLSKLDGKTRSIPPRAGNGSSRR